MNNKIPVAIIGTGNIGIDLLYKIKKSDKMYVKYFVGRNKNSKGLNLAKKMGIEISSDGISFLEKKDDYDIVFDATSAQDHIKHAKIFKNKNKKVIDLTPSKVGDMCIPLVDGNFAKTKLNINMITCGGQVSLPIIYEVSKCINKVKYIEVVTSISSKSAGFATRKNIDEYIIATESAIKKYTQVNKAKVILNLNPAEPPVDMQTTIYFKIEDYNINKIHKSVEQVENFVKSYAPGYQIVLHPTFNKINENNIILTISIRVRGNGDYLPSYAGNLDIITCGAIYMAEKMK